MSEDELALFNWQLDNPASADMAVARRMGLFAVALLAARHGITVTLSKPQDGGTTAEVYLPAALISLDARPGGWRGRTGEPSLAGAGGGSRHQPGGPAFPGSPVRLRARASPRPGDRRARGRPAVAERAGAITGRRNRHCRDRTGPEPVDAEPGDGPPIFESVRSGYLHAFGRDLPRFGEQQASQSPTGQPARPPASWGRARAAAGPPTASSRPLAPTAGSPASPGPRTAGSPASPGPRTAGSPASPGPPTAGSPASAGLPQRIPQPGQVRSPAVDRETRQASAAEIGADHAGASWQASSAAPAGRGRRPR